jgi:hypothetical protein
LPSAGPRKRVFHTRHVHHICEQTRHLDFPSGDKVSVIKEDGQVMGFKVDDKASIVNESETIEIGADELRNTITMRVEKTFENEPFLRS